MSEPVSSRGRRFIFNAVLLTTSGLAARKLSLEQQPFAMVACVIGGVAAALGLLRVAFGSAGEGPYRRYRGNEREFRMLRNVSQGVLELIPLPLVNMELYAHSLGLGPLALAHGIFVVPLLLDLYCSMVKQRKDCDLTESLRDLSMLGNIISIGFLSVKESNFIYMRMTLIMLVIRFYPVIMDTAHEEAGEDLVVCGTALFFHMLGKVAQQWTEA
ncbi:uncharacterized protein LOC6575804 [Drosophila mojavensis]|uniref:Uncharacterized protein n=1 Tax=Drosophila mojavensis TaxID=7230 RepID=B4KHW8_DROMO|nr:uncharacterized protein LOC6575804 [Drosophila mojavensis]EDW11250.1 uncharacterized protein Dmoj_GI17049 [Drosophila mojavensis]